MPPFVLRHIDHVVFRVRDLDRAIAFYGDVLGCDVVRRRDDLGLVHLRVGTSLIDLVALDGRLGRDGGAGPGAEGRNVDHLCLRIEPFEREALLAHLRAHRVDTDGEVHRNFGAEGDGPSVYLRDPDGNRLELKGPAD